MRTIGLLGGMSWESSAEYYRLVNELARERLGGTHSAPCVLFSFDFAEIEALQAAGDWKAAGARLSAAARAVEAAGAELLVLCTNTMHRGAAEIEAAVAIPFLHVVDVVGDALVAAGVSVAGLLGTAYTMESDLYAERLGSRGLRVVTPGPRDRDVVHRVIYEELVRGVVLGRSRERYAEVIARLVDEGAEGVILGCTEIELLIGETDASVPLFPTTRLHAEAAVAASLER